MSNMLFGLEASVHLKIAIRGKPSIDMTMNIVEPEYKGEKNQTSQYAAAGSIINAILECNTAPAGTLSIYLGSL